MKGTVYMEYVPNLTLSPGASGLAAAADVDPVAELAKRDETAVRLDISQLTAEEQTVVREFSKQINIVDTNAILTYGAASQKNISDFSEMYLSALAK